MIFFLSSSFSFRMVPWRKCAWKAWKVSNTIEEQAIIVYSASSSQGMSWKVHFEFAYGHIKTEPYFPCDNKDGFFFCQFF